MKKHKYDSVMRSKYLTEYRAYYEKYLVEQRGEPLEVAKDTVIRKTQYFDDSLKQFILRCGDQWEAPFLKFYGEFMQSDEMDGQMEKGEDYLECYFNQEHPPLQEIAVPVLSTGEEQVLPSVNDFWKNADNAKSFIDLLEDYRKPFDKTSTEQAFAFSKNINQNPLGYIYEILQNADDCLYPDKVTRSFTLDLSEEGKIIAHYNECGMTHLDIISLTTLGKSTKKDREKKLIGEKGIGFKTIFAACHKVEIYSGGYSFSLDDRSFQPTFIHNKVDHKGTTLVLNLQKIEENQSQSTNANGNIFSTLLAQYGYQNGVFHSETAFRQCPVLFTNQLDSITLKKDAFSFTVVKEATPPEERSLQETPFQELSLRYTFGEQTMQTVSLDCLALSKPVTFTFEEYASRYPEQYTVETFPKEEGQVAITYDIVIVAPKKIPEQFPPFCGNLYSFLPTFTSIMAPFNLQIPLKLNLDRSCMWYKGDQDTSGKEFVLDEHDTISWNTRLWKETYGLIEDFYKYLKNKVDLLDYAPYFQKKDDVLFQPLQVKGVENLNTFCKSCKVADKNLFQTLAEIAYFKGYEGENYYNAKNSAMFDTFIMNLFKDTYFKHWKETYLSEKNLVECHVKGEKLQRWCENFQIKVDDELKKTELLNACFLELELEADQRNQVLKTYFFGQSPSIYLPQSPFCLDVFLVKRGGQEGVFLPFVHPQGRKRIWCYSQAAFACYGSDILCFWDVSPEDFRKFEVKYLNYVYKVSDAKDVFTRLSKNITLNQGELEELMTFLAGNFAPETEWNTYAQKILKGQERDWSDSEVKALAKMILTGKGVQSYE